MSQAASVPKSRTPFGELALRRPAAENLLVDQVLGGVQLTQRQFVVISVVQNVEQIGEERMDFL